MDHVELLSKLISCRSVTSDIAAVNRVEETLCSVLENAGLFCTVEVDPDGRKVLFAATEKTKTPALLLNAHADIVPACNESQYTPEIRDGKIYARGTSDCLGNVVCIADILIRSKGKASVGAFFTADEETGGTTTAMMVKRGYSAEKAIVIMDCNYDDGITVAQKGIVVIKLTAHGKGGHSSAPWTCENPIDKLVSGYARLLNVWKNPGKGDDRWNNTMASCILQGGSVSNQIPDEASVTLNFRFIHDGDEEKILEKVRSVTGLDAEIKAFSPCVSFSPDGKELELLRSITAKYFPKKNITFHRMDGATDARHMKELHVPLAVMGIRGPGAHSALEYAEIDSIQTYSDLLCEFAEKL